jgi:hypothetical protein
MSIKALAWAALIAIVELTVLAGLFVLLMRIAP